MSTAQKALVSSDTVEDAERFLADYQAKVELAAAYAKHVEASKRQQAKAAAQVGAQ